MDCLVYAEKMEEMEYMKTWKTKQVYKKHWSVQLELGALIGSVGWNSVLLFGFKEMDPSVSGRGAESVYRDKVTGARISKEELIKSKKKDKKPKEIKVEWGKGLAQKWEAEARQLELEQEKDKPFARTRQSEKRRSAAELEKRGLAEARNCLSVDVCCSEDVAGARRKCHLCTSQTQ